MRKTNKVAKAAEKTASNIIASAAKVNGKVEEKKEVVAEAVVKPEPEVEVKEAVKEEKKAAEVKEEKKTTKRATTKKAAEKKADLVPEVYIQFQNREDVVKDVIDRAKEAYVADGHRASAIKSMQVYLKPEEDAAYYVINKKYAGKVALF